MMPRRHLRRALLSALVAGACSAALPSSKPLGGTEQSDAGVEASAEAAASAAPAPSPKPKPRPEPPAAPPPSASAPPSAMPSASAPPTTSSSAGVAKAPAKCDRTQGTPGDCSSLKAGGEDCVFIYSNTSLCESGKKVLLPGIAESYVACLLKRSGTAAICQLDAAGVCMLEAIATSCPDPKATATCGAFFGRCTPPPELLKYFNRDSCVQGLASLQAAPRAKFEACMAKTCDVDQCLGELM